MQMLTGSTALGNEASCDGQRLDALEAINDNITCAILIDDELVFPRNIIARDKQIWLIDKGSNLFINGKQNGSLYLYEKMGSGYQRHQVLSNLDDPNDIDIRQHSNGQEWIYFTSRDKVQRIKATALQAPSLDAKPETIISKLSTYGWHKLVAIHLSQDALYLTIPSTSDHCEIEGLRGVVEYPCSAEKNDTAVIREYTFDGDELSSGYKVIASGLRDALAVQLSTNEKKLIVADNGWDQIDLRDTEYKYVSTPHDEINIIDLSKETHFGWPYCFDTASVVPPYQRFVDSCEKYQAPHILLMAHSAPLTMMYFNSELLVNLHGNNQAGGKTASFKLNDIGVPLSESHIKVNWQYNNSSKSTQIGRPFGLSKTEDNELLVTDDWNHQLIKIVFDSD